MFLLELYDCTGAEDVRQQTEQELLDTLPNVIREQVCMVERPMHDGSRKRKRRDAQLYTQHNNFQPKFDKMRVGSIALFLAPQVDDREDHLSFRIKVSRSEHSRLMYMAVVDNINVESKSITWVYIGPRKSKFARSEHRVMATENASKSGTWVLQTAVNARHTAVWNEEEMILSWDREANERGWCLPKEQYAQAVVVHTAMDECQDHCEDYSDDEDS